MTESGEPSKDAAHKVADALLPWLVNGTLKGDERAFVERHVDECDECRREVDWLRGLHAACLATQDSSGGAAARRLLEGLEAPRIAHRPRGRHPELRWALAGAFAALFAAGTAWVANSDAPALYRTLSSSASAPAGGALVVVFDPATSEFDLRRIVRGAGARIVDGPTQTNAYVLDVPADRRAQALQMLHAERAVILAERLDAGARR
jgi:hypothetical protein